MPTRSLWLQEALAAEDGVESLELTEPIRADVCVVGGGYTGLWTALRIAELEPDASIALVEAGICGGGPSGRNGGFALSWWPKVETLIKRTGEEEAFRLVRASAAAVDELGAFCEREGIDAHFRRGGLALDGDLSRPGRRLGGRGRRRLAGRRAAVRGSLRGGGAAPDGLARPPGRRLRGRRGDGAACAARPRAPARRRRAGRARVRALAAGRARPRARDRPHARRLGGGGRDRPRHRRLARRHPGAEARGGGGLQRHDRHGADARTARGGGLDRRRVDLELPPDGALLPHDERRPDRVRPGRAPACLRRPRGRRAPRHHSRGRQSASSAATSFASSPTRRAST